MATPDISPAEVAITALHLSKTHSDGPALDKELTSALNEKRLSDKSIADLIKEAVPILILVPTSLHGPLPQPIGGETTPIIHHRPQIPDREPFDGTRTSYYVFKQKPRTKIEMDSAIYEP